jgi:cytochrome bd ubiquinol oxidase subunit II
MFSLELILGAALVGALTFYLLSGGVDFGAGIWSIFAFGRNGQKQRALIDQAIGPIWEANHVWLIVAVTILFTAFPAAFAVIATGLHIPLSLMLIGIVIRGTAFAVRTHDITSRGDGKSSTPEIWRSLFAGSSLVTPVLLGVNLGAIASGRLTGALRSSSGSFTDRFIAPWLSTFPFSVGLLTMALVAYLAAVYLLVECREADLRDVFKRRASVACCGVFLFAAYALYEARDGASNIYQDLRYTGLGLTAIFLTVVLQAAALFTIWNGRDRAARGFAVAGAVSMLWGWALSQYPFLVEPDLTIYNAAPPATLKLLLLSLVGGSMILFPLLFYLYRLFKGRFLIGA